MEVFEAIAQPKRREILRLLAAGELSAGEIASRFAVTQPAISQHLKVLKDAGLISERRDAQRRLFSVRPEGLAELHGDRVQVSAPVASEAAGVMSGRYVEVDPYRRIALTWGWEQEILAVPPQSTIVEVSFVPDEEGTMVRFAHRQIPAETLAYHR